MIDVTLTLESASLNGRELTHEELEEVQENNPDWVYEKALDQIH